MVKIALQILFSKLGIVVSCNLSPAFSANLSPNQRSQFPANSLSWHDCELPTEMLLLRRPLTAPCLMRVAFAAAMTGGYEQNISNNFIAVLKLIQKIE